MKEDLILFDFKEEEDAKNVLGEGAWNVDGVILVLKQYPLNTFDMMSSRWLTSGSRQRVCHLALLHN